MSINKHFVVDDVVPMLGWMSFLSLNESYFLVDGELFLDKGKGKLCLLEAIESQDYMEVVSSHVSYEIVANVEKGNEALVIVRPSSVASAYGFIFLGNWQDEYVLALSNSVDVLKRYGRRNMLSKTTEGLFEKMDNVVQNSDWLVRFHSLHIDLNLVMICFGKDCLGNPLEKSIRDYRQTDDNTIKSWDSRN